MKSSCISHPANEKLVIIRKWQKEFCDGNHCAAACLSHFEYWHNWKLNTDTYNRKANNVAAMHKDERVFSEDVLQYHTLQEISDGILGLYGIKAITEAIKLLEAKGVISTHSNPNPRYHYDKTKYFRFYPEVCNEWIKNSYQSRSGENVTSITQKGISDMAKIPYREGENAPPYGENALPITEINNKEIKQSINMREDSNKDVEKLDIAEKIQKEEIEPIVEALVAMGMPIKRFYPDTLNKIYDLKRSGATADIFVRAYNIAYRCKQGNAFGVNYLAKAVEDLISQTKNQKLISHTSSEINGMHTTPISINNTYENDFTNGAHWIDGNE